MVTSINTNLAAYSAQANIAAASGAVNASVARLSSGNAIQNASDNVAGLAIGTSLASNVATLKIAQQNASQGISLLQVANGALSQLTGILQRQQELATQAAAGSLTDTQRGFLDQEFQALTAEINSLAGTTNFNGLNLLDGTLSQQASVNSATSQSTAAQATLSFAANPTAGQTVIINGVTLYAGTDFTIGTTASGTVANLSAKLNSPTSLTSNGTALTTTQQLAIGQAIYSANGATLNVNARTGGTLGDSFKIDMSGTATTGGLASIGGAFGGSYNPGVFATGFTSATTSITGSSSDATHPFQNNDTLTALVGTGAPVTLATVATGDSLQNIINKINANTATTNISATLVYVAGSSTYNMRLNYVNSSAKVDLFGGNNFNSTLGGALTNGQQVLNLLTANAASATAVITSPTLTSPFAAGAALTATIGTRSVTLATAAQMTNNLTYTQLAAAINANSATTGVTAAVGTNNLALTVLDPTENGSAGQNITFANTGFFQNSSTSTEYLNNQVTTYNLFTAGQTGVHAAGGSSGGNPLSATDTIVFTTSDGKVISAAVGAAAAGFASTVTNLNAAAHTAGFDNIQFVETGGAGNKNIQVNYYNGSAKTTPITVGVAPGAFADQTVISNVSTTTNNYNSGIAHTATDAGIVNQTVYGLTGGADNGLGQGNVSVTGQVGKNILTGLVQTPAQVILSIPAIDPSSLVSTLANQTITIGGQAFAFVATATAPNQIAIGSTLQATLDNAVSVINAYASSGSATGNVAYQLNQLGIARSGNSLVFTGKNLSNVVNLAGSTTSVATSVGSATVTHGGTLDNASFGGIDTTGVSNANFAGTISGFTGTYDNSANTADFSVTVGNYTYTAKNVNTNPTTNTTVRFYSNTVSGANGGYFDIQMQANDGQAISDQSGANNVAQILNGAFSSLSFNQTRNISSYNGTQTVVANNTVIGSLVGSSVKAQLGSYDAQKVTGVQVTAPSGGNPDAQIAITINGETFVTGSGLGGQLGANQTYHLISTTDAHHFVNFTTGNSSLDISTSDNAQAVQTALLGAFGATTGASALSFQVGTSASDTINVSIDNVTTPALYSGQSLSLATSGSAQAAGTTIASALNDVTSTLAKVGAAEESFNFASAALASSVQNEDAARSGFLDTDIANESTKFATSQVKLQAGISVLAQANQELQNLLKLIG